MIELDRAIEPQILVANRETWTAEYVNWCRDPAEREPRRYAHPDIRSALEAETHSKCAYCEGTIGDVAYTHIEHKLPKSKYPTLVCAWENLTIACPRCNANKGNYDAPECPTSRPLHRPRREGSRLRRSDGPSPGRRTRQRDDYALKVKPSGIALRTQRSSQEIVSAPGPRGARGQRICYDLRTVARHRRNDGSGRRVCFRLPPVSCGRNSGAWPHEAMMRKPPELPKPLPSGRFTRPGSVFARRNEYCRQTA